uniref:Transposase n=1 Tax=Chenopodium quinoa TaxID=63459 RepID=A0A803MQT2_CHEQI
MSIAMKQKFDKYWRNVNKMDKPIYVASILDPHCKFILVELSLIDMHGKEKGSKLANNEVKEFTYTLFDEYRNMYTSSISQSSQQGDSMPIDVDVDFDVDDSAFGIEGGDDYMKNLGYVMNKLDRFIHECIGLEEEELDALTWWGIDGHRYPVLKCIARDILVVPLSTVASESAFSTGGRTLDPFRSSLTPKDGSSPYLFTRLVKSKGIANY